MFIRSFVRGVGAGAGNVWWWSVVVVFFLSRLFVFVFLH